MRPLPGAYDVRGGQRGGEPVTVDDLRSAAVAALEGVADQLPESGPGQRTPPGDWLTIRSTMLSGALACPAAASLDGEEPFEESAAVVGWGAASTVLDRLVHGHLDPGRGLAPTDPASGFRTALREVDQLEWPWPWIDQATKADKAVTAAQVHRRLAAVARLLDPWPPPDASHVGWRAKWTFPGRPLALQGRADLVLGRRDGTHTLVVSLSGDHGPATRARLAFEAVVEALQLRRPPAVVLGLLPDAGRRWPLQVDDSVLADGVTSAGLAARVALAARRRDAAGLERRPGPRCRTCEHRPSCGVGTAWLDGPGSRYLGFLAPATPSS